VRDLRHNRAVVRTRSIPSGHCGGPLRVGRCSASWHAWDIVEL
jgi:hypothetical protein